MSETHYRTLRPGTALAEVTEREAKLWDYGPWAGYRTPLSYDDEAMEYSAIRNAASLYDLSPMMKYRFSGPDAAAVLSRLTLRGVAGQKPGTVRYTAWCDDAGKVLDDGTLFRLGAEEFWLFCQERHLPWFRAACEGFAAEVEDRSEALAGLSLQGPVSWATAAAAGLDLAELKPFQLKRLIWRGADLIASRTGFTGDLGYEFFGSPEALTALWTALATAGAPWGVRPVGSKALNIARLEAGFLIAGADFTPAHHAIREDRVRSPFELGLDWLIDWEKGHFNGRRALAAERQAKPKWRFVALDLDGNIPAEGAILYHRKRWEVGVITSAAWSPVTKRNIALAQIEAEYAGAAHLWAEIYALRELHYAKLMVRARLAERPFYAPARRRESPPERY